MEVRTRIAVSLDAACGEAAVPFDLFDAAQWSVVEAMRGFYLARFLSSSAYKSLKRHVQQKLSIQSSLQKSQMT